MGAVQRKTMKHVGKKQCCYAMSATNAPVLVIEQEEVFRVETEDCYSGNLRTPKDKFTKDLWDTVNPASGPIFITGAEPGAILRVDILKIVIRDHAVMCVEHGAGALGELIEGVETTILPIADGRLILNERMSVPVCPMIGVIGTAPRGAAVLNGTPGEHGGNLDCKLITAGAAVYLPVNVPGALLVLGDLHAVMGDGEACICGAEVAGKVLLSARTAAVRLPTPCVETAHHFHVIASAATLDECERRVLRKAHAFLKDAGGMSANEAARALSLLCDLRVCQVVDPLKTMRCSIPKELVRR
jgi:amidase